MTPMTTEIDVYFAEGCGRCPLGGTPDCKVHTWREALEKLRPIVLDSGLTEEVKWGVPCYTFEGKNVLLMNARKEYCSLDFFKGVLLKDPHDVLTAPGENSQAARQLRFTSVNDIVAMEPIIKAAINEAIAIEKAGLKVEFKSTAEFDVPDELQAKWEEDPVFKTAFDALTPGRQRGYLLHFSAAKQSRTRVSRIEKNVPRIMEGKGLHDR